MATIHVDGNAYEVPDGHNLLHVCLGLGFDLPYFCWHPALGSVGACRQCAVKQFHDEKDTRGRLVMSCMTPAADGTRISIADPEAARFRASVIEWLMTNHPHDCPVCEEGGECHLQDMTVMTGHAYRRYRFRKRTFRNQDLGPFVGHEMNRCITCYRCVRFYRHYAGGRDLDAFGAHNHVYFGRAEDGTLESEFAGNLAEVCPTGVFTDKTLGRHYVRKWDLQSAPSVCVHCGVGCNTSPSERYGTLRRIVNRYNGAVNGYFLCDRGRFGYGFVNSDARLRRPLLRRARGEPAVEVDRTEAIAAATRIIAGADRVIGIGSPRATLEANFALRTLVGANHFHAGGPAAADRLVSLVLELLGRGPARAATIAEAERADAVLVLGEDVPNTAPRIALALRQAVRQAEFAHAETLAVPRWQDDAVRYAGEGVSSPLFLATPGATRLDDVATATYRAAPDDLARFGFAVAHALDPALPAVDGLDEAAAELARRAAEALAGAERPLVVSGTGSGSEAVLRAAAAVAAALSRKGAAAGLSLAVPECNSLGLAMMDPRPIEAAFEAIRRGEVRAAIVLENDLHLRAGPAEVESLLAGAGHVIVLDHLRNRTTDRADLMLPAATFAEATGTLVSGEGRAQRAFSVMAPADAVQASWRWLVQIMAALRRNEVAGWREVEDVTDACAAALPRLGRIGEAAPPPEFRILGQKIAREPHRYSGRTAMFADRTIWEPPPPPDLDAPLRHSMEGWQGDMPPALRSFYWAPSWNSVQALNKFQAEVAGPMRGGDPGVPLIEPRSEAPAAPSGPVPAAFRPREGEWLVVAAWDVFASDELARLSPPVARRAEAARGLAPFVMLNPDDAGQLGLEAGDEAELALPGTRLRARVRLDAATPAGVAALLAGIPEVAGASLPAWGRIAGAGP